MSTTVPMPLTDLRQRIEDILAGPPAPWAALPTGVAGLDGVLPAGGIPRGRLTELVGEDGCGRTSVARALVQQTMAEGASGRVRGRRANAGAAGLGGGEREWRIALGGASAAPRTGRVVRRHPAAKWCIRARGARRRAATRARAGGSADGARPRAGNRSRGAGRAGWSEPGRRGAAA